MLKPIIGSDYSVDIENKTVYDSKGSIVKSGDDNTAFNIKINNDEYKMDVRICYVLAKYEIYFEEEDKDWYFQIVTKPMTFKKRTKDGFTPYIDLIPIFSKPLEKDGYRTVPTFFRYEVNDKGIVRRRSDKTVLSGISNKGGYLILSIYNPRKNKTCKVGKHRLVGYAWKDTPDYTVAYYINHKDGVTSNNEESNVEWCTPKENVIHAVYTELTLSKKYLIKDLFTSEITGPIFGRDIEKHFPQFNMMSLYKRMSRKSNTTAYMGRYDIIAEGDEWTVGLTPKEIRIQVKDVKKWENGEDGWLLEFKSQHEAARVTGVAQKDISSLTKSNDFNRVRGGYCFRYKSDTSWDSKPISRFRPVLITWDDGRTEVHESINEVKDRVKLSISTLRNMLRDNNYRNGFKIQYAE